MADEQILEQLRKSISGTFEVHQSIAKFELYRTTVSGAHQTVHVEILLHALKWQDSFSPF